jgi:hypothetical protein
MLLREKWMRKFMVSSRNTLPQLMSGREVVKHSFQMALIQKLKMLLQSLSERRGTIKKMLPREVWMKKSTDSSGMLFLHSTLE